MKPMTESEWLKATNPSNLLRWLQQQGRLSERKCRLFACACVRRVWHLLVDERSRHAIHVVEQADGQPGPASQAAAAAQAAAAVLAAGQARSAVAVAAQAAWGVLEQSSVWGSATAGQMAANAAATAAAIAVKFAARTGGAAGRPSAKRERAAQCRLLRCVFSDPWRAPPDVDPSWLAWNGGTVARLAQAAYDERLLPAATLDPDRLAVLADALEEAGCADTDLLGHLRGPGPHVRGCWILDLLLAK
jgi:hypothetical protein